jgi:hypothetical protein
MSLLVTCPCGRAIQTQPEHRGKRIRCPKCKGILQVPEPEPAPPVAAEEMYLEPNGIS